MDSEYRTKSSVGDGDDEKLKKSRYQEKLGEHIIQRESVVTKGKRRVSKGQEESDMRKIQKTTQEWGRWEKHENDRFKTVQGTGRDRYVEFAFKFHLRDKNTYQRLSPADTRYTTPAKGTYRKNRVIDKYLRQLSQQNGHPFPHTVTE